jgi:hypothetical protein
MTERSSASNDCAYLAALAYDVDDGGAVVGDSDIGLAEFVCAQTGPQCGEDDGEIALCPIGLAFGVLILRDGFQSDSGAGRALGRFSPFEGPHVQYHLTRIYAKLVRSRAELAAVQR